MPSTRRFAVLVCAAALSCVAAGAMAQTQRPSVAQCDPAKLSLTAWDDCLRKGQADSEKTLEDAVAKARAAIDTRTDLTAQQRALLKRQIGDSNDLWVRYRNYVCQNVVPILAGPKAKIYEENLGCVIDMNAARLGELQALVAPR